MQRIQNHGFKRLLRALRVLWQRLDGTHDDRDDWAEILERRRQKENGRKSEWEGTGS